MDEVDKIILETLRALKCDIPEEIISLKQFHDEIVVLSVSTCLEAIIPSSKFPKKLSPSMAIRLKTASYLAEQIKDIGFKDEIGYQTILYFNEVEIRKLFIFLLEKLPRESGGLVQTEEVGHIPKLLRVLKETLKHYPSPWLPPILLNRGTHLRDGLLEIRSCGDCSPLKIKNLKLLTPKDDIEIKNYLVRILPTVTRQCTKQQLIPSLLFEDCKFSKKNKSMLNFLKSIPMIGLTSSNMVDSTVEKPFTDDVSQIEQKSITILKPEEQVSVGVDNIQNLSEQLEIRTDEYVKLRKIVDDKRKALSKLIENKDEEIKLLRDKEVYLELKNKTRVILSQEENLQKLKLLIEKAKTRLIDLTNQWKEVQQPLLEEYNVLTNSLSCKEYGLLEKENEMRNMVLIFQDLLNDLKDKVELEQKLVEKHSQCSKNTNRSTYTKNIMEIIGNIKKQNLEMQKILKDTREIQKDINNLTGQIDRSFTIADEYIFSNAKKDETSKTAYKLLVSLHNECGEIVKVVSEIGFVDRECRNLQELIDIETAKETSVKLKRLNEDLELIRAENMKLLEQVQ